MKSTAESGAKADSPAENHATSFLTKSADFVVHLINIWYLLGSRQGEWGKCVMLVTTEQRSISSSHIFGET